MKKLLLILGVSMALFSCKKDDPQPTQPVVPVPAPAPAPAPVPAPTNNLIGDWNGSTLDGTTMYSFTITFTDKTVSMEKITTDLNTMDVETENDGPYNYTFTANTFTIDGESFDYKIANNTLSGTVLTTDLLEEDYGITELIRF